MTISILTICTGNICRSPLAAGLLAAKLDPTRFAVLSAGTSPVLGEPVEEPMQRVASRLGMPDLSQHRAIGITEEAIANADLILGMDREHRRDAAKFQPNAARRSFTLLEFAHVVSFIDDNLIGQQINSDLELAALEVAMRMRGVVPRLDPERLYDVPDPYGRSKQVYERAAKRIERAVDEIVAFFDRTAAPTEVPTGRDDLFTTLDSEQPG